MEKRRLFEEKSLKKLAALVIRFWPACRFLFTPVAPKSYVLTEVQKDLLKQFDIHRIELHVVKGLGGPVQETRWSGTRAEDYVYHGDTPNELFFLRRVGKAYQLRLGPQYSRQTPQEIGAWVDSFLQTAMSRIDRISRYEAQLKMSETSKQPKLTSRH
jgi:hypothetical protein